MILIMAPVSLPYDPFFVILSFLFFYGKLKLVFFRKGSEKYFWR